VNRAVVTGASGFIGGAVARHLERRGWEVDRWTRREWNLRADVPDASRLRGVDAVFHLASRVGDWGRTSDYWLENVVATERLLAASEQAEVKAFIYTSTPSVVMGENDLAGIDEATPYAWRPLSVYAYSKVHAETRVRGHRGVTRTMALRPHAVIGPGDRHLLPTFGRLASLPFLPRIGDGRNLVHFTSLATAAVAHERAAEALFAGAPSGQAVFVADGPPLPVWEVLGALARRRRGAPPRFIDVRFTTAWRLARMAEWFHAPMPWWPPIINRYRVAMLGRSHWFKLDAMVKILGLEPGDANEALRLALEAA
jgi:nucleoside-diphosphate-sugar epimerase